MFLVSGAPRAVSERAPSKALQQGQGTHREPLPSPLSCTVTPGGRSCAVPEDAGRSSLQKKHVRYMSSDSEDPAVLASLSPNHVVAMATSLPKPELAEGIPINPFLGPLLHVVHPATCPGFP